MVGIDLLKVGVGIKSAVIFAFIYSIFVRKQQSSLRTLYDITKESMSKSTSDFIHYMRGNTYFSHLCLRVHIRFIEQTNLKKYIPWISLNWLFSGLGIVFIIFFAIAYKKSDSVLLSLSLGILGVFIPIIILDTIRQYNFQRIRGDIIHLLSLLGQWYYVSEDMMKCFEKVSEHHLSEPLSTYIEDFVVQVNRGLDISEALEILNKKVGSDFFSVFIINVDQAITNRGDVGIMLKNLEDEAYRLQEEFNRRQISTYHDRIIIYVTMLSVLFIGYEFLMMNEVTVKFYFHTAIGQLLVAIYCSLYLLGFFITMGLSKLEY